MTQRFQSPPSFEEAAPGPTHLAVVLQLARSELMT